MARPELGTKRVCPTTGRKFYDLNKDPIVSPYTGQVVPIAAALPTRGRVEAPARAEPDEETETAETEGAEVISLEDAEDEANTGRAAAPTDDATESEDDEGGDEDTFLEEDEDEDEDVTDLIGDGIDEDEEH